MCPLCAFGLNGGVGYGVMQPAKRCEIYRLSCGKLFQAERACHLPVIGAPDGGNFLLLPVL
jgi:hypothetical protein